MGIENTALGSISTSDQCVTSLAERCVRFLCEKQRYTGQRWPMPASKVAAACVDATVNETPQ